MNIRKLIKSLLLVFLFLSISFLVYKEFSFKSENNANQVAEAKADTTSMSGKSVLVSGNSKANEEETQQEEAASSPQSVLTNKKSKVIAYYFHGNFRCSTCSTLERYSREAIETFFFNALNNGRLEFKPINMEEPENRHYIQDYQLFTKSLVISSMKDDKELRWKNLKDIWTHVGDRERFYQYVKDELEQFLKETE